MENTISHKEIKLECTGNKSEEKTSGFNSKYINNTALYNSYGMDMT